MFKNRFFTFVVIPAIVAVIAFTVRETVATSAIALDPQVLEAQRLERSRAADAARWTAMGEYYQNRAEAGNLTHSRTADAARWTAMAEYYQKLANAEAQNLARARAADAARWTAMADYYAQFGVTTP